MKMKRILGQESRLKWKILLHSKNCSSRLNIKISKYKIVIEKYQKERNKIYKKRMFYLTE